MNVILLTGAARPLLNFRGPLIKTLCDRGHSVLALSPADHDNIEASLRALGADWQPVPFHRASTRPLADAKLLVRLTQILRSRSADVLLSYTLKGILWGSLAGRLSRIPRIYGAVTGLGHLFTATTRKTVAIRTLMLPLFRLAFRSCDKVFFQNPDDADEFVRRKLVDRAQVILTAGSGVDLERFPVVPLPAGPVAFVFVGRFIREKGLVELFDAVQLLRARGFTPQVRLVGRPDANPSGIDNDYVERRATDLEIDLVGWTEDIQSEIAAAHVLVLPSYREGTPRSCLEAMSMGRALIVTDVPGCREVIETGVNGLLVQPQDPEGLADAIQSLAEAPRTVERMAAAGRKLAEDRFDVHLVNAGMISVMGL